MVTQKIQIKKNLENYPVFEIIQHSFTKYIKSNPQSL